jgi:hypothetical protein
MLKYVSIILFKANIDYKRAVERRVAGYFNGAKIIDAQIVTIELEAAK